MYSSVAGAVLCLYSSNYRVLHAFIWRQ